MYKHAPEAYVCPFCVVARSEQNENDFSRLSDVVYHDDIVTAFIASHQHARSAPNILIVPNAHYENIFELPPELGADLQRVAQQIAFALKRAYACDGISTRQHNEPGGSQDVWHYHVHITPRFKNDWFYQDIYNKRLMRAEERAAHAEHVRRALAPQAAHK